MTHSVSAKSRNLIIEHWFRTLYDSRISIVDIAKVIIEFGDDYEGFIAWTEGQDFDISEDLLTVTDGINCEFRRYFCVCGQINAIKGYQYHWKIKLLKQERCMNLGIVESDEVLKDESTSIFRYFWTTKIGYSWYSKDGRIWHEGIDKSYGEGTYGTGDIIDVWLDFKNDTALSFGKNGNKFEKAFDVNPDKAYRLAIGVHGRRDTECKFELISFECK